MLREDLRTRGELRARQSWTVNGARVAVCAPWLVLALLQVPLAGGPVLRGFIDRVDVASTGEVRIVDRLKDIMITAGGKNLTPANIEAELKLSPLISQAVMHGDRRPYPVALITLDPEMLPTWLANNGLPDDMSLKDAAANPKVREEVQRAIDIANKSVSRAESIRKFTILDTEWTEASGHLTPKLSIKRNVIMQDFADAVDELYDVPVNTTNVALGG